VQQNGFAECGGVCPHPAFVGEDKDKVGARGRGLRVEPRRYRLGVQEVGQDVGLRPGVCAG